MKNKNLEESLLQIKEMAKEKPVTVRELLQVFGNRGTLLLIILLTFPFCLPIHIPGLSTPFGIIIFLICLRAAFRRKLWLTTAMLNHEIKGNHLETLTNWGLWFTRKLKPIIHPRLGITQSFLRLHYLVIAVLALFLALPLPIPFSHLLAAWPIFLISLGLFEDDGLLVILGYGVTVVSLYFYHYIFHLLKTQISHYL